VSCPVPPKLTGKAGWSDASVTEVLCAIGFTPLPDIDTGIPLASVANVTDRLFAAVFGPSVINFTGLVSGIA